MRRLGRRKIDDAAVVRDARERGRWRTNGHAIRRRRECEQWREYTHLPRVGARHTPTPHTDEETSTRRNRYLPGHSKLPQGHLDVDVAFNVNTCAVEHSNKLAVQHYV